LTSADRPAAAGHRGPFIETTFEARGPWFPPSWPAFNRLLRSSFRFFGQSTLFSPRAAHYDFRSAPPFLFIALLAILVAGAAVTFEWSLRTCPPSSPLRCRSRFWARPAIRWIGPGRVCRTADHLYRRSHRHARSCPWASLGGGLRRSPGGHHRRPTGFRAAGRAPRSFCCSWACAKLLCPRPLTIGTGGQRGRLLDRHWSWVDCLGGSLRAERPALSSVIRASIRVRFALVRPLGTFLLAGSPTFPSASPDHGPGELARQL